MSYAFVEDWLIALQAHCTPEQLRRFLSEIDLQLDSPALARVTHDQIVRLYQLVALETGDEMMGLWSRPIRSGALKHICESVRAASSLSAAMYRFVTFWNLLLDDHQLNLEESEDVIRVVLTPNPGVTPHRFGHMLMLKLAHGIASWRIGEEIGLAETAFVFERPDGVQTAVPTGMIVSAGICSVTLSEPPFPAVVDVCANLAGDQLTVPAGFALIAGECSQVSSLPPTAPLDVVLPATGSSTTTAALIGFGLLLTGLGAHYASRRRTHTS